MGNAVLEVNELTTKYITRFRENIYAVDHVSLKVEEGKSLADLLPDAQLRFVPGTHMSSVTEPVLGAALADFLSG